MPHYKEILRATQENSDVPSRFSVRVEHRSGGTERKRRQGAPLKPSDLISIVPRSEIAGQYLAGINDDEVRTARMFSARHNLKYMRCPHGQTGLFKALALGRAGRVFAGIDKARRQ